MVALLAATNDADINDVHGKGPPHGGQTRNKGPPGSSDMSFGGIKWHHNNALYACQLDMHMYFTSGLTCILLPTL